MIDKNDFSEFFQTILKSYFKNLFKVLEETNLNPSEANIVKNEIKIYIFFCEWFIECYLSQIKEKKKEIKIRSRCKVGRIKEKGKPKKKTVQEENSPESIKDIEEQINTNEIISVDTENILKAFIRLLNLDLKIIFKNKKIEEDFFNELMTICLDLLQIPVELKKSIVKEKIFEVLTLNITKYCNIFPNLSKKLSSKIIDFILNSVKFIFYFKGNVK